MSGLKSGQRTNGEPEAGSHKRIQKLPLNGGGSYPLFRELSRAFKAGMVHLESGEQCGEHSTEACEEILLFLEGSGKIMANGEEIPVEQHTAVFIPPFTEHNVISGNGVLRYVYFVSAMKV